MTRILMECPATDAWCEKHGGCEHKDPHPQNEMCRISCDGEVCRMVIIK